MATKYKMLSLPGVDINRYGVDSRVRDAAVNTSTSWIKLSAYWGSLQPDPVNSQAESWAQLNGSQALKELDAEIRRVNDEFNQIGRGIGVVLTVADSYPTWLPSPYTKPDPWGRKFDKRIPDAVGVDSPWGWFVGHLFARYRPYGIQTNGPTPSAPYGNPSSAWINVIEIANEPNTACWPQQNSTDGGYYMACQVAGMMRTGDALAVAYGGGVPGSYSMGPGMADTPLPDDPVLTKYPGKWTEIYAFTDTILDTLGDWRPATYQGWSFHNYYDIDEEGLRRWQRIRSRLNAGGPYVNAVVWVTEGGWDIPPQDLYPNSPGEVTEYTKMYRGYNRFATDPQIYNYAQWLVNNSLVDDFQSGMQVLQGNQVLWTRGSYLTWSQLPGSGF